MHTSYSPCRICYTSLNQQTVLSTLFCTIFWHITFLQRNKHCWGDGEVQGPTIFQQYILKKPTKWGIKVWMITKTKTRKQNFLYILWESISKWTGWIRYGYQNCPWYLHTISQHRWHLQFDKFYNLAVLPFPSISQISRTKKACPNSLWKTIWVYSWNHL